MEVEVEEIPADGQHGNQQRPSVKATNSQKSRTTPKKKAAGKHGKARPAGVTIRPPTDIGQDMSLKEVKKKALYSVPVSLKEHFNYLGHLVESPNSVRFECQVKENQGGTEKKCGKAIHGSQNSTSNLHRHLKNVSKNLLKSKTL